MESLQIFDTTLRDGEQSPGFSMSPSEKIVMARQLASLGVNVIEAGFANSSDGDFNSVREIAQELQGPRVVSLARAYLPDIDRAVEALQGSHSWGIHTFIAASPIHMKYKLKMDPDEVIRRAVAAVSHAKKHTDYIEFSAEDATRSEPEFLVKLFSEVVRAGAVTLNVPDTVGYTMPTEMYELIDRLKNEVYQGDQVCFSVHCHNDLGFAVANSLAGVRAGARQVECTINGIGERAGNAALEELIMSLQTRKEYYQMESSVQTEQLHPTSRLLTQLTGIPVQPNKAIVGANAFAHEAGIHQDGVLKNALTYEIMTPQSVGMKANNLVLGKHSGRHALADRVKALGFELDVESLEKLFVEFKRLADLKKQVFDEDLEALITQGIRTKEDYYVLKSANISSGTNMLPTATVWMSIDGKEIKQADFGNGPVDAVLNTIRKITQIDCILTSYIVKAITGGTDAQGEVNISIEKEGRRVTGRGSDPDVVVASGLAFVDALNRLHHMQENVSAMSTPQGV